MSRTLAKSLLVLAVLAVAAGVALWLRSRPAELPPGIVFGNGRLEATEVDVATKLAGRLLSLDPREGDWVEAGRIVARLDGADLTAQLRAAEAQVVQARAAAREAEAGVRKSDSDARLAGKTLQRSRELVGKGYISGDKLDRDLSGMQGAQAGLAQSRTRVAEAEAAIAAAQARVESLRATVNDLSLRAPIDGRVLYRLAEPGEVLAAGGKALTLVDLGEMNMTIYLPTDQAGRVAIHSAARIVLDALPGQVIPATVSFVAAKAQFTPREVETRSEREKLMFRIKVRADRAWLDRHRDLAKAGMPGVAYVRLDADSPWPAKLQPGPEDEGK